MRRGVRLVVTAALAGIVFSGVAFGEGAAGPPTTEAELVKLNATLADIARLLRQQGEMQGLDLMMKRVQLAEGQATETEKRLRAAQSETRSLEEERSQMEFRLRTLPDEIERAEDSIPASQADAMTDQTEGALRRVRQRAAELASEIAELESRLTEHRESVRQWRSALDRRLAAH